MAVDIKEDISWKKITPGGRIKGQGTSAEFQTGDWRTETPVFDAEVCKQCLLCVPVCPDIAIPVVDGKRTDFNLFHCKGCGICAEVCPFDAIKMSSSENEEN